MAKNGGEAVVVCSDKSMGIGITIWGIDTGDRLLHIPTCASAPHGLVCLRNQFLVASQIHKHGSVGGGAISMWPLNKPQQPIRSYPLEAIGPLSCTKDGLYLAGGALSGNVYLWEVANGKLLKTWRGHHRSLNCMLFSDDGSLLVSASEDGMICVWSMVGLLDMEDSQSFPSLLHYSMEHKSSITGLLTTSGSSNVVLISSSLDGSCKVWDLVLGKLMQTQVYPLAISAVVLHPTEQLFFSGSIDGRIFVNKLEIGLVENSLAAAEDQKAVIKGHKGAVTALTFSQAGLVSASEDCTICIWDITNWAIIRRFDHKKGAVTNLAVIPQSSLLSVSNHRRVSNAFGISSLDKYPQPPNSSKEKIPLLSSCHFLKRNHTNHSGQQIYDTEDYICNKEKKNTTLKWMMLIDHIPGPVNASNPPELEVKWSDFPSDFVFGVSTAATQIEGSAKEAGRGPSVWDYYVEKFPERIADHSNMFTALDSYRRYKEDVKAVKNLGVGSYRFSISWTRILPKGTLSGGVNQQGIDHYNSLIDELIKNGITPYVTIWHFDAPQALTDEYGGPLNRSFVNDFKDYSELCFKFFGDRVKNWITINEPFITAKLGYDLGVDPPARCSVQTAYPCSVGGNSATEPYIVAHNILLAHAAAVELYREKFQRKQGGQIGISLVGQYVEPYSDSAEDKAAAKRILGFELGWFLEPLVYGAYPRSMRELVKDRLPTFTEKETMMVNRSFNFIGINYYTSRYGKNEPASSGKPISYSNDQLALSWTRNVDGIQIGPLASGSKFLYSYPQGLQKLLEFIKKEYRDPKIYITENGITEEKDDKLGLDEALKDPHRIQYILQHLYQIKMAIKSGVNVRGYFHWALFDDFEWGDGYTTRFGLYYIDHKDNLKRIPKVSAKWLPKFLKGQA